MKFEIKDKTANVRPSYKELQDVKDLGVDNYLTLKQLQQEFLVAPLKITTALRNAEVQPLGKISKRDPETQKVLRGKPELAFDPDKAREALRRELENN